VKEPENIDSAIVTWIQRFVYLQELAVFEYTSPDDWQTAVTALNILATQHIRAEHNSWFPDPVEPWWERTNEPIADPLEDLYPSISTYLARALASATLTLAHAAEHLLSSVTARESIAPVDDGDDDDAPF